MSEKRTTSVDRTVFIAAIVGSLVLANVVGIALFGRIDLTRDRAFTLSESTHKALASLSEPVTIRAYFTRDLPPPHASQARYVKDLLDAYYTAGHGKVRFEFIDPMADASAEDADRKSQLKQDVFGNTVRESTQMERQLEAMGIPTVQVRVNQADKVEVKRAYMGIALSYQERREVIPVVAQTAGLEYDLTSMVRKLAHERSQKLAVVVGHGGTVATEEAGQALSALKEHYDLGEVDLNKAGTLLPDVDGLLVVGPASPFNSNEIRTLEAFVHSGKNVAFFLPPAKANLQGLTHVDNDHGLTTMLKGFGVELEHGMVLDAACATINIQQQSGFMRVNQPVRYPFIAQVEHLPPTAVGRGLSDVLFAFSGPLKVVAKPDGPVHAEILVRSSSKSWLSSSPYNLDPMQQWSPDPSQLGSQDLMVGLAGPMGHVLNADGTAKQGKDAAEAAPARVLVAASDSFLLDPFFGKSNQALLLNSIDWLMGDDDLLAVRSRGLASAPLAEMNESRRRSLKYGNIVGLPLGFIALGMVRWRRRQARRQIISL